MPNMESVAFTILESLSFNAKKFRGLHDPRHCPLFKKYLRGRV